MNLLKMGFAAVAVVALMGVTQPAEAHSGFSLSIGAPGFGFSFGRPHSHYHYPYYHRAYNYPWWYHQYPRYRYRHW